MNDVIGNVTVKKGLAVRQPFLMKFDKITCYSILGENVQSCEVTVCSQKVTFIK